MSPTMTVKFSLGWKWQWQPHQLTEVWDKLFTLYLIIDGATQKVLQFTIYLKSNLMHKAVIFKHFRGHIFSHVWPFYERAVSDQDS